MKYHSGSTWNQEYIYKKVRYIDQTARQDDTGAASNWKITIFKPCLCSKAISAQIHVLFNLILCALQLDMSPSMYLILLFSHPDFSFFALPFS